MHLPPNTSPRPARLDAVLAFAWTATEFTATDAMGATGLTHSTTIAALNDLAEAGLLVELPNARESGEYRKGRPARRFALNDRAAVVVGIDAGELTVTVRVADLRSDTLSTVRITLDPDSDAAGVRTELVLRAVDDALRAAGRGRRDVLVICAGVPAPVDRHGRSPRHPQGFWGRTNPGYVDAFDWAPIARVENDASLAAVAEGAVGGAVGCANYVALLAGERFGAGVVVDGRLLRGAHGGVGEMSALNHVVGVQTPEGLGPRLIRWVADDVASGVIALDAPLAQVPSAAVSGRVVLDLLAGGDTDAERLARRAGAVLARAAGVMGSMFDPECVVVSGAISAGVLPVVEAARKVLPAELDLLVPDLVVSPLGGDVVVIGAVAAALESAKANILDVWDRRSDG